MEKLSQSIHKELGPVILYLDDIKEIIRILKEEGNFSDITTETMTHKYNDDEIENINSPISKIYSKQPYISIEFREKVSIKSYNDSVIIRGVIQKLDSLLSNNQRNALHRYPIAKQGLTIILLIILVSRGIHYLGFSNSIALALSLAIYLIIILIRLIITLLRHGKRPQKNIFYYKTKLESPSFWQRKKDDIITGIIVLIIGGIGTIIRRILSGGYDTIKRFFE